MMITSLRVLIFWFLVQFTAISWADVSAELEPAADINPPAVEPQWLDMPGYELILGLQESLQTGQGWDELYNQYINTVLADSNAALAPGIMVNNVVEQTVNGNNQQLSGQQDSTGFSALQGIENSGVGWDEFNQQFFTYLTSIPGLDATGNSADDNPAFLNIELSLGNSGMSWDEYSQQYFDNFNANFDWGVFDSNGNIIGDSGLPPISDFLSGYNGLGNYSNNSSTFDGYTSPSNGTSSYNLSGGFGGGFNAANFYSSLKNDIGYTNTFIGSFALGDNLSGHNNTASGVEALFSNKSGSYNTANGSRALKANRSGQYNSAIGGNAMNSNISGSYNAANGFKALYSNTTGNYNTADGARALFSNSKGKFNTAIGLSALLHNGTGQRNTALGTQSLAKMSKGDSNLALGMNAGINLVKGFNNVYIANPGASFESKTIRIGRSGHARTFIGGIRGRATGMSDSVPVVIDSNGQLGTINSSARFKKDIKDMNEASRNLLKLRPVTYRYKQANDNGENPIEYGLIAEEVAEVYPELVAHSADGQIETVQYHKLTPMLLNELLVMNKRLQQAQAREQALEEQLAEERQKNQQQSQQLAVLSEQVKVTQIQAANIKRLQERLSRIEAREMVVSVR